MAKCPGSRADPGLMKRASDFRDGDIVLVSSNETRFLYRFEPFMGVVDSNAIPPGKKGLDQLKWVWVRKFGSDRYAGGWAPSQCRRVARPTRHPLPVPENITLGEN